MNIYVIYKFDDKETVEETISKIREEIPAENHIFMFPADKSIKNWHHYALRKLKDSQLVILFDSVSGKRKDIGKNICWELKKAEKLGKRIVVFKSYDDSQDRTWYELDYSEREPMHSRLETINVGEAVEFLKEECSWTVNDNLLSKEENTLTENEKLLLLEQYRIMVDTSEKLMERRQETVNLYTTLCTTLIAFIGASFAFGSLNICAIISFLSGLILVILCHNWQKALRSFEANNTGKFKVINAIEEKLPAIIFQCERQYNKINGIRSFSSREKVLPTIFSVLGVILALIAIVLLVISLAQNNSLI